MTIRASYRILKWHCFCALAACGGDDGGGPTRDAEAEVDTGQASATFEFTGEFTMGSTIAPRHKCPQAVITGGLGDNVSPPLSWRGEPDGTQSFAVVLYDTRYNAFHWALWDIPPSTRELPEGIEPGFEVTTPSGARQLSGVGPDKHAYYGPCSDAGPFAGTYEYRLYALNVEHLALAENATYAELEAALEAAVLESVAWEGTPE